MQTISKCRSCKSKKLRKFFDLGKQPLANSLLKNSDQKEDFYPLSLSFCLECNLVQLDQTVESKKLFSNYVWVTGSSKTAKKFSEIFCKELIKRSKEKKRGYVLEIGSNDGTFLKPFKKRGFKVFGIDPAKNVVDAANKNGIPGKALFFGSKPAGDLLKEKGPAQIVIARNVLPHVTNTRDFVKGLEICLSADGTLAIEVHYAKKILEELHYDSIYHEHLCYFALKSLERLLNDFNLHIFDIKESPISGGSIIIFARKNKTKESMNVSVYREREAKDGTNDFSSWKKFAKKSLLHNKRLSQMFNKLSKEGKIVGYGASARSSTLLNYCGIDSSIISVIADKNPMKQKLFTAGSHILIKNPKFAIGENPKFVVILAWNFESEIMQILKIKYKYHGFCILPLPNSPRIIRI